jgi:hypothetical protein
MTYECVTDDIPVPSVVLMYKIGKWHTLWLHGKLPVDLCTRGHLTVAFLVLCIYTEVVFTDLNSWNVFVLVL